MTDAQLDDRIAQVDQKLASVAASPMTSHWLRDAIKAALNRDCVDAWGDAECLAKLLRERLDAIQGDAEYAEYSADCAADLGADDLHTDTD